MPILPSQNKKQVGSGFTNLNRFLGANKQNQLGQAVAGGVQQAGQQARGAINTAGQQFQEGLGKERARLGQQEQRVTNVLGNIPGATDEDVNEFESIRSAQSLGPTGVANANELRAKSGEAESLGRAAGSEAGRFGLLQRFVGRGNPQYTAGQQRLDQMLLGQTGQQQLRGARAGTLGLTGQAEQQITGAQAQGQEAQGEARKLAEATVGRLGGAVTDYDKAMQDQLAAKQAGVENIISQLRTPTANAGIELNEATLKGLSEASGGILGEGTQLFNADISPFLQANKLHATKQGVQSAQDFAKAQMLAKLSGQSLAGQEAGTTLQDYTGHEDLVGKFDSSNQFDVTSIAGLNDAIQKSKKEFETQLGNAQTGVFNMTELLNAPAGKYGPLPGRKQILRDVYNREHVAQAARSLGQGLPGGVEQNPAFIQAKQELQFKNPTYQDIVNRAGQIVLGDLPQDDASIRAWAGLNHTGPTAHVPALLRQVLEAEQYLADNQKIVQDSPGQFHTLRKLQKKPVTT